MVTDRKIRFPSNGGAKLAAGICQEAFFPSSTSNDKVRKTRTGILLKCLYVMQQSQRCQVLETSCQRTNSQVAQGPARPGWRCCPSHAHM